jgi:hypothetical protein
MLYVQDILEMGRGPQGLSHMRHRTRSAWCFEVIQLSDLSGDSTLGSALLHMVETLKP